MSHEKKQVNTIYAGDVAGPADYVSGLGTHSKGEVRKQHCQINTECIHRLVECRTHEKLTSVSKKSFKTLLPYNEYG
jgi:hypothetical protein